MGNQLASKVSVLWEMVFIFIQGNVRQDVPNPLSLPMAPSLVQGDLTSSNAKLLHSLNSHQHCLWAWWVYKESCAGMLDTPSFTIR